MGYKFLGYAIWQATKWYLGRKTGGPRTKLVAAGLGAAALAGVLLAGRQASRGDD